MFEWLLTLVGLNRGYGPHELARRLHMTVDELEHIEPTYHQFRIPKRTGGQRQITAPSERLKAVQRAILHKLLARLRSHPAATGFEKGQSIVTNAQRHCGQEIVIHFDIVNFFPSIKSQRVFDYFRFIGWNRAAARLITSLVTYQGSLPQGAPTSPRISNLVNYILDERFTRFCEAYNATYTRYADDISISLSMGDDEISIEPLIAGAIAILRYSGYDPHITKKFSVRRRHHQQRVTGLVVNDRVNLPRKTRRWLRAVEHRLKMKEQASRDSGLTSPNPPTLTKDQINGWRGIVRMVESSDSLD